MPDMPALPNLLNFTLPELTSFVTEDLGQPRFRAVQIWQWIWQRMARSFDEMTSISKDFRARLKESAVIEWPAVDRVQTSADGTTKFGDDKKWGYFPGLSVRWNIIDDHNSLSLGESLKGALSMLALRAS